MTSSALETAVDTVDTVDMAARIYVEAAYELPGEMKIV
jgi:hypothetical protein